MKVLVTGAAGWVGRAVLPELVRSGHEVTGLARSDASASVVESLGGTPLRGDVSNGDFLAEAAMQAEGVIHLAFNHDFSRFDQSVREDYLAITTLVETMAGRDNPLVVTGGTPIVPGQVATESDHDIEGSPGAQREANAKVALDAAQRGVRSSVIRLPRSVHGEGDKAFVPQIIQIARERHQAGYVGDGSQRWPAVHVKDAAVLYRIALESAQAGSVFQAVGEEGVAMKDIAELIGEQLDEPVRSADADDFGFLGNLMSIDQPASAQQTMEQTGWKPMEVGLLDDMKQHYFGQ